MNKTTLTLILLGGGMASCVHDQPETVNLSEDFGNAVRHNVAVQTINPDAGGADASESLDGQSIERAIEDMRERGTEVRSDELLTGLGN
ncbi:MAG: hypothetical protein ACQETO_09760 [Pseudomonadota bacterium]